MKEIRIRLALEDGQGQPVSAKETEGLRVRVWTQDCRRYLVFTDRDVRTDDEGDYITTHPDEMDALDSGVVEYAYGYFMPDAPQREITGKVTTDFYWRNAGGMRVPGARVTYAMLEKIQDRAVSEADKTRRDNEATRQHNEETFEKIEADNAATLRGIEADNAQTRRTAEDTAAKTADALKTQAAAIEKALKTQTEEISASVAQARDALVASASEKEAALEAYTAEALGAKADAANVPKLAFIKLWNEACKINGGTGGTCGRYNEETGFFELNGIIDIGLEEAIKIYQLRLTQESAMTARWMDVRGIRVNLNNFYLPYYTTINLSSIATRGEFEVFVASQNTLQPCVASESASYAFQSCYYLKKIIGLISFSRVTQALNIFLECASLEDFRIMDLKISLSLAPSSKVKLDSLKFLVEKATNTSPITITVHPDVYAKLTDDHSNAAVQQTPLDELAQWIQLLSDAAAKNISFATV